MPEWALVYAVVLFLGLIAGLLLRFFLGLACVLLGAVGLGWLLGYVNTSQVVRGVAALGRILAGVGVSSALLFSVVGVVFLLGMCVGVLLTSRLRALDRIAVA